MDKVLMAPVKCEATKTKILSWENGTTNSRKFTYFITSDSSFRAIRPADTGVHSDMQESRMSSSRIREDNFPMILEAKIQKQQNNQAAYPDDYTNQAIGQNQMQETTAD